jgi:hypothetical protein
MKKKIFNRETVPSRGNNGHSGSWISIQKSGNMTFSKDLIAALKLETRGGVIFIQDEDHPKDWYLEVSNEASGAQAETREKWHNKNSISIYCESNARLSQLGSGHLQV